MMMDCIHSYLYKKILDNLKVKPFYNQQHFNFVEAFFYIALRPRAKIIKNALMM